MTEIDITRPENELRHLSRQPDNEGRAYLYHGHIGGLYTAPNWVVEGDQGGYDFDASVSTAGDVNGDEYSDVIVESPYQDDGQIKTGDHTESRKLLLVR